jgi:transcriptional regulator with XRE-family HTH domain
MTGEELKAARRVKKLTAEQVGLMLGFDIKSAERTVQHWESGKREVPLKHIRKLSEILEIPIDRFIP